MCFTSRIKDIKMTSLPEAVCWHSTLRKGRIWCLVMDECLYDLSVIELCESRNKTEKTISNLHFLCNRCSASFTAVNFSSFSVRALLWMSCFTLAPWTVADVALNSFSVYMLVLKDLGLELIVNQFGALTVP